MYKFIVKFHTMMKDQCISVTDLRVHTKQCLEDIKENPKYIFTNNRLVAVLLDIDVFEAYFPQPHLVELPRNEVDENLAKEAQKAHNRKKSDLINI